MKNVMLMTLLTVVVFLLSEAQQQPQDDNEMEEEAAVLLLDRGEIVIDLDGDGSTKASSRLLAILGDANSGQITRIQHVLSRFIIILVFPLIGLSVVVWCTTVSLGYYRRIQKDKLEEEQQRQEETQRRQDLNELKLLVFGDLVGAPPKQRNTTAVAKKAITTTHKSGDVIVAGLGSHDRNESVREMMVWI